MANFNKKNLINFIINLFCIGGLLFQSKELLSDYLSGKTVINMELKHLDEEPIPALTLCLRDEFSMHQVCKEDIFLGHCENYMKNLEKYSEIVEKYQNTRNVSMKKNIRKIEDEFYKIYYDITRMLLSLEINLAKFVRNHSIDLHLYERFDDQYNEVRATGKAKINDSIIQYVPINFKDPIESMIYFHHEFKKCFTFFSFLQEEWRSIKMKFSTISIQIYFSYRTMPIYPRPEFSLSIHSPNTLPNLDKMATFSSSNGHEFLISQINTELLDEGFDTNCFEYDLDHKHGNYNMHSDCITSCIQDSFDDKNCFVHGHIYRFDLIDKQNGSLSECWGKQLPQYENYLETFDYKCRNKCRKDCMFRYYTWTHKEFNYILYRNEEVFAIDVQIHHNYLPDVVIKYIEQTSFISFVCNFGGLLGMWLGLSIMVIFGSISDMSLLIFQRKAIYWQRIKNISNNAINILRVPTVNLFIYVQRRV